MLVILMCLLRDLIFMSENQAIQEDMTKHLIITPAEGQRAKGINHEDPPDSINGKSIRG